MPEQNAIRNSLKKKEWAYRLIYNTEQGEELSEAAKVALADLKIFCNGTRSIYSSDALDMARMAGRQEVFQRVMNFLQIDYSEFYLLQDDIEE